MEGSPATRSICWERWQPRKGPAVRSIFTLTFSGLTVCGHWGKLPVFSCAKMVRGCCAVQLYL